MQVLSVPKAYGLHDDDKHLRCFPHSWVYMYTKLEDHAPIVRYIKSKPDLTLNLELYVDDPNLKFKVFRLEVC